jgi:hypothetical protein
MGASLSNAGAVNQTAFGSYDDGDPTMQGHAGAGGTPWHRRLSPELWLWLIVIGSIAGLWGLAGGFRKVLG